MLRSGDCALHRVVRDLRLSLCLRMSLSLRSDDTTLSLHLHLHLLRRRGMLLMRMTLLDLIQLICAYCSNRTAGGHHRHRGGAAVAKAETA